MRWADRGQEEEEEKKALAWERRAEMFQHMGKRKALTDKK